MYKRLNTSLVFMRHLFLCTVLLLLPVPLLAQSARSVVQPRQRDFANRLLSNDPKIRASAKDALVQGGVGSLPLLRQFLNSREEGLHYETFEIIRRIGPPAIPLLAELLQHRRTSFRQSAADALIDLA